MSIQNFQKYYDRLNSAQKQAVDTIEGPVMVVAGPGTGKTQILTLRIANILLKTDVSAENILALTFTESGVSSMRKRLASIIGTAQAHRVSINTFHGFCNNIIQHHPEEFPHIIGGRNISDVEQISIVESIIDTTELNLLKPFGDTYYYLRNILSSISTLKREGVSPAVFSTMIDRLKEDFENSADKYHEKGAFKGKMKSEAQKEQKKLEKNSELAVIYSAYQKVLHEKKFYDYSDMIMEVARALSNNEDLLLTLQEQYQYILVDEHQDTNNAQNTILTLLSNFHHNPNLFVVGDEKQAIFRFQGASLENFLYFKKIYPEVVIINLEENYRSSQVILDASHAVLAGRQKLRSQKKHAEEPITIYAFSRPENEYYYLAKSIEEKISNDIAPHEIAVLYRDNIDSQLIVAALEKSNIPFCVTSDQNILEDEEIKKIILLLKLINNFGSDELLAQVMHIDFCKIHPLDLYKIIARSTKKDDQGKRTSLHEIIERESILSSLDLEGAETASKLYSNLVQWAKLRSSLTCEQLTERVVRESGVLAHILIQVNTVEILSKLMSLFAEMRKMIESGQGLYLKDFIDYLSTLETHNILIKQSGGDNLKNAVRLMTAHKSKGLEFEYVYIVNAHEGHWGGKKSRELLPLPSEIGLLSGVKSTEDDNNDDERRLFYVAITRAKKQVNISYSKESISGKEQLPCQFIEEIHENLKKNGDVSQYEDVEYVAQHLVAPRMHTGVRVRDSEYIKTLFDEHGLSVTALNNYLDCPWKYFYNNLLRIPRAMTKHQIYGVAVHDALKDFFDNAEKTINKDFLISKFNEYLSRQIMSPSEMEESKKKGETALSGYFDTWHNDWIINTVTEYDIKAVMLDDVRLTGKIDKIEILGDGKEVNVVDYKTSKPKSRNEIEGKTASSNGGMKRQLAFYRLLLDNYDNQKYKMISGEIDFIEPDEKGLYKKEKFTISDEELELLQEDILRVSNEIRNGLFWDKRCEEKDCEYCALREMME